MVRMDLPQMVDFGNKPLSQLAGVLCVCAKKSMIPHIIEKCCKQSQEKEGLPDLRGALDRNGEPTWW